MAETISPEAEERRRVALAHVRTWGDPVLRERARRVEAFDDGLRAEVPDAWLAALALSHGCRLATADRGFARFEDLDWFVPVERSEAR